MYRDYICHQVFLEIEPSELNYYPTAEIAKPPTLELVQPYVQMNNKKFHSHRLKTSNKHMLENYYGHQLFILVY